MFFFSIWIFLDFFTDIIVGGMFKISLGDSDSMAVASHWKRSLLPGVHQACQELFQYNPVPFQGFKQAIQEIPGSLAYPPKRLRKKTPHGPHPRQSHSQTEFNTKYCQSTTKNQDLTQARFSVLFTLIGYIGIHRCGQYRSNTNLTTFQILSQNRVLPVMDQ
jgi:hypothetical protein